MKHRILGAGSVCISRVACTIGLAAPTAGSLDEAAAAPNHISHTLNSSAEGDFMRRVLAPPAFAHWLSAFLPQIPHATPARAKPAAARVAPWLVPGVVTDRADPKLAHIDGLNLSRAWMLESIAHALPEHDPRRATLLKTAAEHAAASLPAVTGGHYEGGHWLGTYAVYLTSEAGLRP
jgi:Protein of unknown function (DUF2891)